MVFNYFYPINMNSNPTKDPSSYEECSICFESLTESKNICKTNCGHSFCFNCITRNIYQNEDYACPLCRTLFVDVSEEEGEHEFVYEYEDDAGDDQDDFLGMDDDRFEGDPHSLPSFQTYIDRIRDANLEYDDLVMLLIDLTYEPCNKENTKYESRQERKQIRQSLYKIFKEANSENREMMEMTSEDRNVC